MAVDHVTLVDCDTVEIPPTQVMKVRACTFDAGTPNAITTVTFEVFTHDEDALTEYDVRVASIGVDYQTLLRALQLVVDDS